MPAIAAWHNPANVGGTRHDESWKTGGPDGSAVPRAFSNTALTTRYGRSIDFARGRWNGRRDCHDETAFNFAPWIDLQEQARWIIFRSLADEGRDIRNAIDRAGLSRRDLRSYVFRGSDISLTALAAWSYGIELDLKFNLTPREDRAGHAASRPPRVRSFDDIREECL